MQLPNPDCDGIVCWDQEAYDKISETIVVEIFIQLVVGQEFEERDHDMVQLQIDDKVDVEV
jgi:hypothetical protein